MYMDAKVVDLYCGVGGLTHGFVQEGFDVVAGIDFDESCKYAYEQNNKAKFIKQDLTIVESKDIDSLFQNSKYKILVGCAPCQAFSTLNNKSTSNEKWKLLYSFSRIIKDILPDIVSMENVPNLVKFNGGKVFNDFIDSLENCGYQITHKILNARDYGVPQNRNRLILIASLKGKVTFLPPVVELQGITLATAIKHLPKIEDGETHYSDKLHRSRKLSPLNKKRIQHTPKNGGWRDWPEELLLECHKRDSGKTYRSVYGRMDWDSVAPTLTTQCTGLGNGRFGHPDQDRAISLREAAIIQSFPEDYDFINPNVDYHTSSIERHIGNAVPVKLGNFVARTIEAHLKEVG